MSPVDQALEEIRIMAGITEELEPWGDTDEDM